MKRRLWLVCRAFHFMHAPGKRSRSVVLLVLLLLLLLLILILILILIRAYSKAKLTKNSIA